ncbi:zinc-binding alcohol dehydrogenase family protein [Sphingomonas arantia]|uniref:Zinc-type alcohol dehydrogenase-like protein n=1 Tax=Sphingomonas arantia TaxID=1460676 RepID=A0ABW4TYW4_9SPHN
MRAIAYRQPGAIDRPDALIDIDLPQPVATGRDLLIAVEAVSVNPVDAKVRGGAAPFDGRSERILGWDAAGVVAAVGPDVTAFKVGDAVWYAGSLVRDGSNAEYQLVDERIVGRRPHSLTAAAALPLTAITAWEVLFDRLRVSDGVAGGGAGSILIIGGAGGVGSIAIQIARARTDLTVIATASRPETRQWVRDLGAHHVIDHARPLTPQIAALGIDAPAFVFSTTHTDRHLSDIAELIAPQGRFALIDDPAGLDIVAFKRKSVSVHWELMFTRSLFETADMAEQGRVLDTVAELVDAGAIRTTLTETMTPIDAANLIAAHCQIESATTRGKIVLAGWGADAA